MDLFEFSRKFTEIIAAQGAPPESLTPEKFSNQKSAVDTTKFATGINNTSGTGGKIYRVVDTGSKFATGFVDKGSAP